ncbi:hypothetical protein [Dokdonella ginsengisoli]|uniref:HAF repeat-containing protein n=1 Tax=Dokdonella ginsengisoli TaxID=363846 RepID=A0ABV9QTK5_9GAMM
MRAALLLAGALLAISPARADAAGFSALGTPGARLLALSRDGRAGAGALSGAGSGGFRWSEAEGVRTLAGAISVQGISSSGRYVAGSSLDGEQREVASYWNADAAPVRLGGLPGTAWQGGRVSIALAVSDEPRVVGVANDPAQRRTAFEWRAGAGMRALPLPPEARAARAGGISDDGRRVHGWIEGAAGARRGVLWSDGAPQLLSSPELAAGEVLGANRDLTLLFGASYLWRAGRGAQRLPPPARPDPLLQLAAGSDDGRLLAGSLGDGALRTAAVWTRQSGAVPLDRWLASRGIAVPHGWRLVAVTGVSGDGRRIGGWGQHDGQFDSFVVELPIAE